MHTPTLSIVIPVFNAAHTIGELIEALELLAVDGGHELILVNDGSADNSLEICRSFLGKTEMPITLVDLARNFGEHNAVMAGLSHARGDHVITMDDDLQNPPAEVLRLLSHAQSTGKDVVYACYEEKRHTYWRNLGSRFANWSADRLLDKPKGLYLSSFRCLNATLVRQLRRYTTPFPYIDGLIMQSTQSIDQLRVQHVARAHGSSNYTMPRLVRLWLDLVVNFSVLPLRLESLLWLAMSVAGLVGIIWVVAVALLTRTPQGWASLAVFLLLFSGVQFIVLGLIGEYLGRLFLVANGKPQWAARSIVQGGTIANMKESG